MSKSNSTKLFFKKSSYRQFSKISYQLSVEKKLLYNFIYYISNRMLHLEFKKKEPDCHN